MKETTDQGCSRAVTVFIRSFIGGSLLGVCFAGIFIIFICICGVTNINRALRAPTPVPPTPRVNVGSYPIQDVDSYATPGLVLWDLTHSKDPLWDWHTVADDQDIRDYLESKGYTFDLNKVGVLHLDISKYSLIVLELGCCANKSAYTSDEADTLYEYVKSGGSLMLFGENASIEESRNLNVVSEKFGIELSSGDGYDSYDRVYRFAKHPINNGVNGLDFVGAGVLGVSPPATPVAWNVEPPPGPMQTRSAPVKESVAIAVAEIGKGKVVAVGDSDFITKEYLGENERLFMLNAFNWLTQK